MRDHVGDELVKALVDPLRLDALAKPAGGMRRNSASSAFLSSSRLSTLLSVVNLGPIDGARDLDPSWERLPYCVRPLSSAGRAPPW